MPLELGEVDVLVNNAGLYPTTAFLDVTREEWRRVISVNLDSVFLLSRAFVPGTLSRGWARVVSVSSTTFHSGIGMNTPLHSQQGWSDRFLPVARRRGG